MNKLILVDGYSILEGAFYNVPNRMNTQGEHTNGLYGFLNVLLRLLDREQPQYLTVVFGNESREILAGDVENTPEIPQVLNTQILTLKEMLVDMQIHMVEQDTYKTKDLLGSLAAMAEEQNMDVILLSCNRELLQLVTERTKIVIPAIPSVEGECLIYDLQAVESEYGLEPTQLPDKSAIADDESGKYETVSGIGEKAATVLLQTYGSLQQIYEHVEEISPNYVRTRLGEYKEQIAARKEFYLIKKDCSVSFSFSDAEYTSVFTEKAYDRIEALEFSDILEQFDVTGIDSTKLEKNFSMVSSWQETKKIFQEITAAKDVEIGLHFVVEEAFFQHYFSEEEESRFVEQGGQLSLFEVEKTAQETFLKGVSISVNQQSYYLDPEKEWFDEKQMVEQIRDWFLDNKNVAVLDLKHSLYILKKLCKRHEISTDWLNSEEMSHVFDLSVAAYLVNPLQEEYSYDYIAKEYLHLQLPSEKKYLEKKSWQEKKAQEETEFGTMCCYFSYVAGNGVHALKKELESTKQKELYEIVELPLVFVLFEMEQRGVRVNNEELKSYGERLQVRIGELETSIYEQAGETFNINSPKQLGVILFEKLQLPNGKKTKTGYSTSAEVLERLKPDHQIVADILEYRQLAKLKSTYADGLANYICPVDGRIHGKFNQTITATGRLSSTEPNLQNIPIRMEIGREIRKVFIPKEGYVFLDADYSQIELRILAHMSGDESLIQAYNTGKDIHRITASEVFHTPFEEVTKEQRSNAKAVNFGIVYGISSFGLGQDLNISRKEAEEYIHRYFDTYPGIKKYLDDAVEQGKKNGYAVSLMGRRRPVPELASNNYVQRSFGERIAMNSPIQGTAADIMKLAMIRVNDRIRREGLKSELLLQIHDELLVETHPDEIEEVRKILQEEMYRVLNLSVPLEVEVEQGENWNEAH